jgi:hypothetical protein
MNCLFSDSELDQQFSGKAKPTFALASSKNWVQNENHWSPISQRSGGHGLSI